MTIYFIRAGSHVKIGHTTGDPMRRLKALQTGNARNLRLVATLPGNMEDETRLHRKFDGDRVTGEWFTYGRPIRSFIKSLKGWTLDVPARDETFITELWHCLPDLHRGVDGFAFSSEEIAERARHLASLADNEGELAALHDWDEDYVTQQLRAYGIPVTKLLFWDAEPAFTHPPTTPKVLKYGFVDDDLYEFFRIEYGTWIDGTPLSKRERRGRPETP